MPICSHSHCLNSSLRTSDGPLAPVILVSSSTLSKRAFSEGSISARSRGAGTSGAEASPLASTAGMRVPR